MVLYMSKVKTGQVKEVPKSTSDWQSGTIVIVRDQNPKRCYSSPESLCTKMRDGALHVFLLWPVVGLSFDARIKAALCRSSSPRVMPQTVLVWLRCSVEPCQAPSGVWQDMGIEGTLQGFNIPVTISCQHKAWAQAPAGPYFTGETLHRTGQDRSKRELPARRLRSQHSQSTSWETNCPCFKASYCHGVCNWVF